MTIHYKTPEEIAIMREAGRIVAMAHQAIREAIRPGVTTGELNTLAETVLHDHGATAAFLGYPKPDSPNYPASICASVNDELVHGIPGKRALKRRRHHQRGHRLGLQGLRRRSAWTYPVGEVTPAVQRLLEVSEEALWVGIRASVMPNETRDVSLAIQHYVERQGYSVVREYTGHGVGARCTRNPQVPNWWPRGRQPAPELGKLSAQAGDDLCPGADG